MRDLASRDLRNLLAAVQILNEDLALATLGTRTLAAVSRVISCDVTTFNEVDLAANAATTLATDDCLMPGAPGWAGMLRHIADHPTIAHYATTGDGSPHTISDFMSQRQFRSTGIYAEAYRPAGLDCQMTYAVPGLPQRIVGGSVNRTRRDFTSRERACLEVLRAHIAQAYWNAERFEQMQRPRDGHANGRGDGRAWAAVPAASDWLAIPESPRPARVAELTRREAEVLHWASCGKTNEEIAIIIGAAAGTVKKHLEHVYDKLGVSNRTAAVMRANGLRPGAPMLVNDL
jgi:DNA-binding CsgD family transcriptional regulator